MSDSAGREIRARYAFAGSAAALDRTVPLAADESVLLQGVMRLHRSGSLPRPALLRLTPPRLAVLLHRAFGADRVVELPRAAVRSVALNDDSLSIDWVASSGEAHALRLTSWTGRRTIDNPLRDIDEVGRAIARWRQT